MLFLHDESLKMVCADPTFPVIYNHNGIKKRCGRNATVVAGMGRGLRESRIKRELRDGTWGEIIGYKMFWNAVGWQTANA